MTIMTLTTNNGHTTIYVNAAMVVAVQPAQSGGGSVIVVSGAASLAVDQTPAEVYAML